MTPAPDSPGATAYEIWVRTVRAWAVDPTTPLNTLPRLADDTFAPDTYQRLIGHIMKALDAVSLRWSQGLERAMGKSHDPHLLGTELVQLRAVLARRVQLSRHPALPPKLAEALERNLQETVAQHQRDLEKGIARHSEERTRFDPRHQEAVLRVVRENSFLSVLDYAISYAGDVAVTAPIPVSLPHASPDETYAGPRHTRRWAHRVIAPPQDRKD